MTPTLRVEDPSSVLLRGGRILVDTSAFLEHEPDRTGGLTTLVTNSAGAILEQRAPIVVVKAVRRELEIKSKQPSPPENPHRAEKAAAALIFIRDLESDGLATTQFGANTDPHADEEFDGIVHLAASLGISVCLLTNDNTRKIATRLCGAQSGIEQFAGRLRSDGLMEVESAPDLYRWGIKRMGAIQRSGFPGKYDRQNFDELAVLLPRFAAQFHVPTASVAHPETLGSSRPTSPRTTTRKRVEAEPFTANPRRKTGDTELPLTAIPGPGDTVRVEGPRISKSVVLGARIGKGKEGVVYEVAGRGNKVVKIFPQKFRTKHRRDKVTMLVDRDLRSPGICFPEARVLNDQGEFVGYLMRTAVGGKVLSEMITNRPLFKRTYPDWRKDDLIDVCLSFLKRVKAMHDLNILVGDMNEGNLMVSPNRDVWIIDTDSCQFEGYVCPVGWPEFTAPELTSYDKLRTEQHELFAVAMVLFMILMTGRFAYDRADAPVLDDDDRTRFLIKEGKFAYKFRAHGDRDQPFGDAKFMWSHIDPKVKELFWETLHRDGRRYTDRPTVQEWIDVFRVYKRNLASTYRWQDPMSHDVYPIRYKARTPEVTIRDCPRCGWENGVAGWLDDNGGERIPTQCNRCAPKCQGCGDPDQFLTFREGLCRTCREDDQTSASTPRVTQRRSTSTVRQPMPAPTRTSPAAPARSSSPQRTPQGSTSRTPASATRPVSAWQRFKKWLSGH